MKFFNTAGPVTREDHYCLPPMGRLDLDEILELIGQKKYFVLHAPRQTGKTSCLLELMKHLNTAGHYKCLYINAEVAQGAREDVYEGIRAVLGELADRARLYLKDGVPRKIWKEILDQNGPNFAFNAVLTEWCLESDKPLVLLIDEVDSLIGDTLLSFLRQLRAGYDKRPGMFPQSIILCGVRDVRDYRFHASKEKKIVSGGSVFNIKAESLRLGDFTKKEIVELYGYHTEETGQIFADEAMDIAWELSEGQPWLVNALAYEVCFEMQANRNREITITPEMMNEAGENLILRRETHIDQLTNKLKEERVRRVIEPVLAGEDAPKDADDDDLLYVRDLGLIKVDGNIRVANRLYMEVIPRALTYFTQSTITHDSAWYVREEDGALDMEKLLAAFQDFFRKHSEKWTEGFQYREAAAQLLMQAFLSRIINSGGTIHREYGLGRQRTDLLLVWPHQGKQQEVVIELKIRYGDTEKTIAKGLEQTWEYMDKCGAADGNLVIFDKRKNKTWEEKIFRRQEEYKGHKIMVWGM